MPSYTKGFLYEITTTEKELMGYLFGTIHELSINKLEQIHPKVLACFDRSSHLFMEAVSKQRQSFSEDEMKEIDQLWEPKGVDEFLYKRALMQKKSIRGLETELSRKEIDEQLRIDEECSHLLDKAKFIVVTIFGQILKKYNHIAILLSHIQDIDDLGTVVKETPELISLLVYLIENQRFLPDELKGKLFSIIDETTKLLCTLEILPSARSDFLHEKLFAQLENDKKVHTDELEKDYVEGNSEGSSFKLGDHSPQESSLTMRLQELYKSLRIKQTQARDAVIAEKLHEDLETTLLTQGKKCEFYAVGAIHVLGHYPDSLPELLKKKGWILNKVDLSSALEENPLMQYSLFASDEALVKNRHESPELQELYDRKFGLVAKKI